MNTLHMYHWQEPEVLQNHLPLMGQADALVIYGVLDPSTLTQIRQMMIDCNHQWYWHSESVDHEQSDAHRIDLNQWLDMMVACRNSWAWK